MQSDNFRLLRVLQKSYYSAEVLVASDVARVWTHLPIRGTLLNKRTSLQASSVGLPIPSRPRILARRITKANNGNYISIEL